MLFGHFWFFAWILIPYAVSWCMDITFVNKLVLKLKGASRIEVNTGKSGKVMNNTSSVRG